MISKMMVVPLLLCTLFTLGSGEPLRLMVVGDWGQVNEAQTAVAQGMGEYAEEHGVDYIMSTGDNFYYFGVSSPQDPQFNDTWRYAFAHPGIADVTWLISLGNHDHMGIGPVEWNQVEFSQSEPRWILPNVTYTYTAPAGDSSSVQFFAIDTQSLIMDKNDKQGQLRFLEDELAASTADWKIVFGHHPAYSCGLYAGSETLRQEVEPLMIQYDVDFYIAGHDHNLDHWQTTSGVDVDHIISGGGSMVLYPLNEERLAQMEALGKTLVHFSYSHGFAYLIIDDSRATVTLHSENGEELYSYTRHK